MTTVKQLAVQLSRQDTQSKTLISLLQLAACGHDVSLAAEQVVRYCLHSTSSTTSPQVLSLALDVLKASPSHKYWKQALAIIIECVKANGQPAVVALSKIPGMPHAALQHLALYSATPLIDAVENSSNPQTVRIPAITAVAALVLRDRPLSAVSIDTVRLEKLTTEHGTIVRNNIARLLHALYTAIFDGVNSAVSVAAFSTLTSFAASSDAQRRKSILSSTRDAIADTIWNLLMTRLPEISKLFKHIAMDDKGPHRRLTVKALAQLCAKCVAPGSNDISQEWANLCISKTLLPLCITSEARVAATSCSSLLHICSNAGPKVDNEDLAKWGVRAVSRITKLLQEHEGFIPTLVVTGLVQDATRGLAALSKNEFATSKFIIDTGVNLLSFAVRCPRTSQRLEALSIIAATIVEFDLSGKSDGSGSCLASITKSSAWKRIINGSEESAKSPIRAELVCCFAHALLDAGKKIYQAPNPQMREGLTDIWALMLANLIRATLPCLTWKSTPAVAYAKQVFLKMFEALGQYSTFIFRRRAVGMEEYEVIQEAMVKATSEQEDVNTRSALLTCITKYWLSSGLKAESNAGHVLTAIWKHAQDHFQDEQIMMKELQVGAAWSDAENGESTAAQRAVEGGYVSVTTAITKRTRVIADTVGTVATSAFEEIMFGSIALRTAAAEGSSLITDYAYTVLSSCVALVHQNPKMAEQVIGIVHKYRNILDAAQSSDLIVYETIDNSLQALSMYQDEFFPKNIPLRALPNNPQNLQHNPHAWLARVTESCVYATSRVDDSELEAGTVTTEEAILRAGATVKSQMKGFNSTTLHGPPPSARDHLEGNQQILNGASDPFSVIASHGMDTVKGLALLRITVTNRSAFAVPNASITCSAAGALVPLPDAPSELQLGSLEVGASIEQRVTYAVRYNSGYAGRIFLCVLVRDDPGDLSGAHAKAEQPCLPYYVPSSDVLLLRTPTDGAGVDVFRRRWDLMRAQTSFHVIIGRDQSVDSLVDVLERRSRCLREVGRMRTYSHVSTLVADSSRGDYIAMAIVAPEAMGIEGKGSCVAHIHVRSNSPSYSKAFRGECRDWLKSSFKVVVQEDDGDEGHDRLALKPQDSFFVTDGGGASPYDRWRRAHSDRLAH